MEPTKRVPPYLPFKTFLSSLDALSHGVPPKLDRTLWRSQSGVTQGLIMNAYRFFGLVEDSNLDSSDSSTEYLDQMAKHPDKRPEVLRFLIETQYEPILEKHDLTKMTLKMLEDAFDREFSVSGGTKQKAITFFLKAAKFADMPLSPYLVSLLRATRKKRGPRQRGQQENGITEQAHVDSIPAHIHEAASTHSVRLVSGGTLTVSITANPFKMPQEDRQFVFSIVDQLQKYENDHGDLIPNEDVFEDEQENV
jgi:hypothetical protein